MFGQCRWALLSPCCCVFAVSAVYVPVSLAIVAHQSFKSVEMPEVDILITEGWAAICAGFSISIGLVVWGRAGL